MATDYITSDGKTFSDSDNFMASHQAREHQAKLDGSGSSGSSRSSYTPGGYEFSQAESYENQGRLTEAVDWFTKALDSIPYGKYKAIAYARRGQVYFNLKQYNDAIEDFETAIGHGSFSELQNKTQQSAYGQLGDSYKALGQVEKAIEAYKKATDLGHPNTASIIAWLQNPANAEQVKARGTSSSSTLSAEELCKQGNSASYKGDYEKAFSLFSKAADQGNAEAQCELGFCFEYGQGVNEDKTKAVYWYGKAAEQGHARGMGCLGECYLYGNGVIQDFAKAEELLNKAITAGFNGAKSSLAELKKMRKK